MSLTFTDLINYYPNREQAYYFHSDFEEGSGYTCNGWTLPECRVLYSSENSARLPFGLNYPFHGRLPIAFGDHPEFVLYGGGSVSLNLSYSEDMDTPSPISGYAGNGVVKYKLVDPTLKGISIYCSRLKGNTGSIPFNSIDPDYCLSELMYSINDYGTSSVTDLFNARALICNYEMMEECIPDPDKITLSLSDQESTRFTNPDADFVCESLADAYSYDESLRPMLMQWGYALSLLRGGGTPVELYVPALGVDDPAYKLWALLKANDPEIADGLGWDMKTLEPMTFA